MAPNKKYLSLEEAAVELGIKPDELIRLREKGQVRGFADRGTWKFKADDIDEYRRSQQLDSDPDIPIYDESDDYELDTGATQQIDTMKSDSDVRLRPLDQSKKNLLSGSSAELNALQLQGSDSDIRLVEDARINKRGSDSDVTIVKPKSSLKSDSDSDVKMVGKDPMESDSDVKLLDSEDAKPDSDSDVRMTDSDSDVRMAASDSDVRLAPLSGGGVDASDSDIRLAPLPDSDSDVKLLRKSGERDSDSDVMLLPRGQKGAEESDPLMPLADSSVTLAGDSGIKLAGDSGIKLGGDSGIRLAGDSGIRLSEDSGIQLLQPADSGISLEGDSGIRFADDSGITVGPDSGIKLSSPSGGKKRKGDSSRNLRGKDDIESTAPMLLSGLDDGDSAEVLSGEFNASDTSELPSLGDSGQNVEIFDDDEDGATRTLPKRRPASDESLFEIDEEEDDHTMALEELEVSEEDLHEDGDFEDLDFDAGDDIGDDSFAGASSEFSHDAISQRKIAVPREVEWTAGTCGLLFLSLCVLVVGSVVSADLLRNVWAFAEDSKIEGDLVTRFASLWQ